MKDWFIQNLKLARYIFLHKYYVIKFGLKLKVPLYLLIIHDWSKFLPDEFFAHAAYFFGKNQTDQTILNFKYASLRHIHRNKHHEEYWILRDKFFDCNCIVLEMPLKYVRELVSDWASAGYVKHGYIDVRGWYYKNKWDIQLHKSTRKEVEKIINKYF